MRKFTIADWIPLLCLMSLFTGCEAVCTTEFFLTAKKGVSKNYTPSDHLNRVCNKDCHCAWTITADDKDAAIHLRITDIDLDTSPDCSHDNLSIYDSVGPYPEWHLATLCACAHSCRHYNSSGQQMYVAFKSDASVSNPVFTLQYSAFMNSGRTSTTIQPSNTTVFRSSTTALNAFYILIGAGVTVTVLVVGYVIYRTVLKLRQQRQQQARSRRSGVGLSTTLFSTDSGNNVVPPGSPANSTANRTANNTANRTANSTANSTANNSTASSTSPGCLPSRPAADHVNATATTSPRAGSGSGSGSGSQPSRLQIVRDAVTAAMSSRFGVASVPVTTEGNHTHVYVVPTCSPRSAGGGHVNAVLCPCSEEPPDYFSLVQHPHPPPALRLAASASSSSPGPPLGPQQLVEIAPPSYTESMRMMTPPPPYE